MLNHSRSASRCQRVYQSENEVFSSDESPQSHFFKGLKEIGVQVLNLEVDGVDKRNFAARRLRTRVEAFVEMPEGRS